MRIAKKTEKVNFFMEIKIIIMMETGRMMLNKEKEFTTPINSLTMVTGPKIKSTAKDIF